VHVLYLRAASLPRVGTPVSSALGLQIVAHISVCFCYLVVCILQQVNPLDCTLSIQFSLVAHFLRSLWYGMKL
jgi:hypothetical protein